jgi:hypothetical protein
MSKSKRKDRDRRGHKPAHREPGSNAAAPSRFNWYFVRFFPVLVGLLAIGLWLGAKSARAAAITGALGAIVWLTLALGSLGSQVPPRDRNRAGAIDFGKRN